MNVDEILANEKKLIKEEQGLVPAQDEFVPPVEVIVQKPEKIANVTEETKFTEAIGEGMVNILKQGYVEDEEFKNSVKDKVKETAEKRADLETQKVGLEAQHLDYQSELLQTEQQRNIYNQERDKYDAKRARRQFVYDGVKPIMTWVGIKEPMNIVLMTIVTVILILPFIVSKPITALLVGVDAEQRKKQAIAWLWTILALFCTGAILLAVLLPLSHFGII